MSGVELVGVNAPVRVERVDPARSDFREFRGEFQCVVERRDTKQKKNNNTSDLTEANGSRSNGSQKTSERASERAGELASQGTTQRRKNPEVVSYVRAARTIIRLLFVCLDIQAVHARGKQRSKNVFCRS